MCTYCFITHLFFTLIVLNIYSVLFLILDDSSLILHPTSVFLCGGRLRSPVCVCLCVCVFGGFHLAGWLTLGGLDSHPSPQEAFSGLD